MRAVVIGKPGGPEVLSLEDRPVPQPGPGEIRVRVHASALNRADLLQRRGSYPAPPGAPADIPGLEYAGEVDAVGEGAGLWAVGNRVMGIVGGGGHAEYVVVHEREGIRIPQNLSWEEAAAIPEVFLTAYDALFRQLDLTMGERLLILAVGSGVGTAALQLASAAGATVIGTSRTAGKLKRAQEMGLEIAIDTGKEDLAEAVNQATYGSGVHAVLDLVGGKLLEASLRVVALRGRVVVVGTTGGANVQVDLGLLLRRRIHLFGTVLRSRPLEEKIALAREFSNAVLPLISSARIRPVVDSVFPMADIRKAHERMEENASFGKIVLTW
ncbi:MAG TPA: NAD(P)H-quinone oxidoreductase [Longimicrobium sp.]|jgi:putative PIG3 family NAD(P)H quinone oxidoreductase|uniref:NAD(P)H-quinone oxidoreductase n=1 Tax=Longimicrobium sp. TaxID=2029185 RepID=UPI002EDA9B72